MSRRLLLHVGLPKTATTHLQNVVFPALDHLTLVSMPRGRYFAAASDAEDHDRVLATAFKRDPSIWDEQGEDILQVALGKPAMGTSQDVLLSEEGMGRVGSRSAQFGLHLERMALAAGRMGFSEVEALCLFRRQDRWLGSHYAQVSNRNPAASQADFDAFIDDVLDPRKDRFRFGVLLDYAALHRAACDALGRHRVHFLAYELMQSDPTGFDEHLAQFLGGGGETLQKLRAVRAAAAPHENMRSEGGGWRLRPPATRLRSRLRKLRLDALLTRPGLVSMRPEQRRRVQETYGASNRALAAELGLDLESLGYISAG